RRSRSPPSPANMRARFAQLTVRCATTTTATQTAAASRRRTVRSRSRWSSVISRVLPLELVGGEVDGPGAAAVEVDHGALRLRGGVPDAEHAGVGEGGDLAGGVRGEPRREVRLLAGRPVQGSHEQAGVLHVVREAGDVDRASLPAA